jgi:Leucine-rich repeat (LRR) protein
MLRACLFASALLSSSLFVAAQTPRPIATTRVILLADTARYGISPAQLRATYIDSFRAMQSLPEKERNRANQKRMDFGLAQTQSVEAQGPMPAEGFMYGTEAFYKPDGRADWVFVKPTGEAPDKLVQELLTRLAVFYQNETYPVALSKPFYVMNFGLYGRPREKRTVRTGDSIIGTLEAARATARPDTVKYLLLNGLGLRNVPEEVYRFPNLEELDLSKNILTQLPARLTTDLPNLKRLTVLFNHIDDDSVFIAPNDHLLALTLQGNRLTRIPETVRNARNLESLWMGNNRLKELNVRALRGLKHLYDLNFYNAGLTTLPRQIRKLKHVQVLDLYYNDLTVLPKQIGRMRRLEQLAVANNQLTALPPQLAKLKYLQLLYAHHNNLSKLPEQFARFRSLRLLDVGYNRLSALPEVVMNLQTLESIDISGNNIQVLPGTLTRLTNLRQLFIRSNPITETDAKAGPYAKVISQLEAQKTEVFY